MGIELIVRNRNRNLIECAESEWELESELSARIRNGNQGRIWRAFRAFPGRPWRRTQDSVGHKTDDKREKKKQKKTWEKGQNM